MPMEFFASDDELVAGLPADDQEYDLLALYIIQHAEVTDAQLELGQRVGTEPLDGLGRGSRLVPESGMNCRLDDSLLVEVFVLADEDDDEATGDGTHSPDAKDIGLETLRLRKERRGDSDGRVYLILVLATDASGNTGFDCVAVVVPHGQSSASTDAVMAQAAAAKDFVLNNAGTAPPGFVTVGDGPILGPHQ